MRLKIVWRKGWAHLHGSGPNGERIRRSLQTQDPKRAEEARAQIEAKLWKVGLYGIAHEKTFDEAALEYAEDGGDARFLMKLATHFAGMKLREITPRDIRAAAKKLYPKAKASTLNRQAITPARAVVNYGHAQGWCAPIKVPHFETEKPQRKAVDRDYLDALEPHLPRHMFVMMVFLQTTGRRVSDAINLQVKDLELAKRRALIERPKNGEPIYAYLTKEVTGLIAEIMPNEGAVFGYAGRSSIYPTMRRACKKAGVEYLGTHQPGRHSFATALHNGKFSSSEIAKAGGWKSVRLVSETYVHVEDAGSRAADFLDTKLAQGKNKNARTSK